MRSNLKIHIYNFTFFSSQFAHGTHFQDKNKTGSDLVSENTTGRPLTHMCKWRLSAKTFAQCPVISRSGQWQAWCHLSRVNPIIFLPRCPRTLTAPEWAHSQIQEDSANATTLPIPPADQNAMQSGNKVSRLSLWCTCIPQRLFYWFVVISYFTLNVILIVCWILD